MHRPLRLLSAIIIVMAIGASSFAGGYVVGRDAPASGGVLSSSAEGPQSTAVAPPEAADRSFTVLEEAWRLIWQEYYKRTDVDPNKLSYGAIEGLVSSLGDPHTAFSTPQQARVDEDDLRGKFEGIGVTVEMREGKLTVVSPLADSPGARAGILPGDVIIQVDGRDIAGMDMLDAVALIRGPRGTTVKLTIMRGDEKTPRNFEVVREEIKLVSVQAKMLDGAIAYVSISSFGANTNSELVGELRSLLAQKPQGLVLDLRNNPGGLLDASVDVASQFLSEGVVLYEQRGGSERQAFEVKEGGVAREIPMVVLINKGSASASEIVAGALQDHGRAKLVGERSFGKDTVQNVHTLSDQSSLRITVAQWFTPNSQDIHEKGLRPDVEVAVDEKALEEGRDVQLERAVQVVKESRRTSALVIAAGKR